MTVINVKTDTVAQGFQEARTTFAVGRVEEHAPDGDKSEFREALIEYMAVKNVSAASLAKQTGVSKSQIDKMRQRKVEATNVSDAMKLAAFFGKTVEEFCAGPNANPVAGKKMQTLTHAPHTAKKTDDHPLWGWAQGTVVIMPGVELTGSLYSDAEMDEMLEDSAILIESGLKS